MDPGLLADIVVSVHLLYVVFTVGGQILILVGAALRWQWTRNLPFRVAHLTACLFVALEAGAGVLCPLTGWENALRTRADQRIETDLTFIARMIRRIIFYDFPDWVFTLAYMLFGASVLITFLLHRPVWRRRAGVTPRTPKAQPTRFRPGEPSRKTPERGNPSRGSRK